MSDLLSICFALSHDLLSPRPPIEKQYLSIGSGGSLALSTVADSAWLLAAQAKRGSQRQHRPFLATFAAASNDSSRSWLPIEPVYIPALQGRLDRSGASGRSQLQSRLEQAGKSCVATLRSGSPALAEAHSRPTPYHLRRRPSAWEQLLQATAATLSDRASARTRFLPPPGPSHDSGPSTDPISLRPADAANDPKVRGQIHGGEVQPGNSLSAELAGTRRAEAKAARGDSLRSVHAASRSSMVLVGSSASALRCAPGRRLFAQDGTLCRLRAEGCSLHVVLVDPVDNPGDAALSGDHTDSFRAGERGRRRLPVLASQCWLADAVALVGGTLRVVGWDGETVVMRQSPWQSGLLRGLVPPLTPRSRSDGQSGPTGPRQSDPSREGAHLGGLLMDVAGWKQPAQARSKSVRDRDISPRLQAPIIEYLHVRSAYLAPSSRTVDVDLRALARTVVRPSRAGRASQAESKTEPDGEATGDKPPVVSSSSHQRYAPVYLRSAKAEKRRIRHCKALRSSVEKVMGHLHCKKPVIVLRLRMPSTARGSVGGAATPFGDMRASQSGALVTLYCRPRQWRESMVSWACLASTQSLLRSRQQCGFTQLACEQQTIEPIVDQRELGADWSDAQKGRCAGSGSAAGIANSQHVGTPLDVSRLSTALRLWSGTKTKESRRYCTGKVFSAIAYTAAGGRGSSMAGQGSCECHLRALGKGYVMLVVSTPVASPGTVSAGSRTAGGLTFAPPPSGVVRCWKVVSIVLRAGEPTELPDDAAEAPEHAAWLSEQTKAMDLVEDRRLASLSLGGDESGTDGQLEGASSGAGSVGQQVERTDGSEPRGGDARATALAGPVQPHSPVSAEQDWAGSADGSEDRARLESRYHRHSIGSFSSIGTADTASRATGAGRGLQRDSQHGDGESMPFGTPALAPMATRYSAGRRGPDQSYSLSQKKQGHVLSRHSSAVGDATGLSPAFASAAVGDLADEMPPLSLQPSDSGVTLGDVPLVQSEQVQQLGHGRGTIEGNSHVASVDAHQPAMGSVGRSMSANVLSKGSSRGTPPTGVFFSRREGVHSMGSDGTGLSRAHSIVVRTVSGPGGISRAGAMGGHASVGPRTTAIVIGRSSGGSSSGRAAVERNRHSSWAEYPICADSVSELQASDTRLSQTEALWHAIRAQGPADGFRGMSSDSSDFLRVLVLGSFDSIGRQLAATGRCPADWCQWELTGAWSGNGGVSPRQDPGGNGIAKELQDLHKLGLVARRAVWVGARTGSVDRLSIGPSQSSSSPRNKLRTLRMAFHVVRNSGKGTAFPAIVAVLPLIQSKHEPAVAQDKQLPRLLLAAPLAALRPDSSRTGNSPARILEQVIIKNVENACEVLLRRVSQADQFLPMPRHAAEANLSRQAYLPELAPLPPSAVAIRFTATQEKRSQTLDAASGLSLIPSTDFCGQRESSYSVRAMSVHAVLAVFREAVASRLRGMPEVKIPFRKGTEPLVCLGMSATAGSEGATLLVARFVQPIGRSPEGGAVCLHHEVTGRLGLNGNPRMHIHLTTARNVPSRSRLMHDGVSGLQQHLGPAGSIGVRLRVTVGSVDVLPQGGLSLLEPLYCAREMARAMDAAIHLWIFADQEKWRPHLSCAVLRGLAAFPLVLGHGSGRDGPHGGVSHGRQSISTVGHSMGSGRRTIFRSVAAMTLPSGATTMEDGRASRPVKSSDHFEWAKYLYLPVPTDSMGNLLHDPTGGQTMLLRGAALALARWVRVRWDSTREPDPRLSMLLASNRRHRQHVRSSSRAGVSFDLEAALPHVVWAEDSVRLLQLDENAARTSFGPRELSPKRVKARSSERDGAESQQGTSLFQVGTSAVRFSGQEMPALSSTNGAFGRVLNRTLCSELALSTFAFVLEPEYADARGSNAVGTSEAGLGSSGAPAGSDIAVSDLKNAMFLIPGNQRSFVLAIEWLRAEGGEDGRPATELLPLRARLGILNGSGTAGTVKFSLEEVADLTSALLALSTTALLAATERWCVLEDQGTLVAASQASPQLKPASATATRTGEHMESILRLCPSPFKHFGEVLRDALRRSDWMEVRVDFTPVLALLVLAAGEPDSKAAGRLLLVVSAAIERVHSLCCQRFVALPVQAGLMVQQQQKGEQSTRRGDAEVQGPDESSDNPEKSIQANRGPDEALQYTDASRGPVKGYRWPIVGSTPSQLLVPVRHEQHGGGGLARNRMRSSSSATGGSTDLSGGPVESQGVVHSHLKPDRFPVSAFANTISAMLSEQSLEDVDASEAVQGSRRSSLRYQLRPMGSSVLEMHHQASSLRGGPILGAPPVALASSGDKRPQASTLPASGAGASVDGAASPSHSSNSHRFGSSSRDGSTTRSRPRPVERMPSDETRDSKPSTAGRRFSTLAPSVEWVQRDRLESHALATMHDLFLRSFGREDDGEDKATAWDGTSRQRRHSPTHQQLAVARSHPSVSTLSWEVQLPAEEEPSTSSPVHTAEGLASWEHQAAVDPGAGTAVDKNARSDDETPSLRRSRPSSTQTDRLSAISKQLLASGEVSKALGHDLRHDAAERLQRLLEGVRPFVDQATARSRFRKHISKKASLQADPVSPRRVCLFARTAIAVPAAISRHFLHQTALQQGSTSEPLDGPEEEGFTPTESIWSRVSARARLALLGFFRKLRAAAAHAELDGIVSAGLQARQAAGRRALLLAKCLPRRLSALPIRLVLPISTDSSIPSVIARHSTRALHALHREFEVHALRQMEALQEVQSSLHSVPGVPSGEGSQEASTLRQSDGMGALLRPMEEGPIQLLGPVQRSNETFQDELTAAQLTIQNGSGLCIDTALRPPWFCYLELGAVRRGLPTRSTHSSARDVAATSKSSDISSGGLTILPRSIGPTQVEMSGDSDAWQHVVLVARVVFLPGLSTSDGLMMLHRIAARALQECTDRAAAHLSLSRIRSTKTIPPCLQLNGSSSSKSIDGTVEPGTAAPAKSGHSTTDGLPVTSMAALSTAFYGTWRDMPSVRLPPWMPASAALDHVAQALKDFAIAPHYLYVGDTDSTEPAEDPEMQAERLQQWSVPCVSAVCIQPAETVAKQPSLQHQLANFDQYVWIVYRHKSEATSSPRMLESRAEAISTGSIVGRAFSSRYPPEDVLAQVHARVCSWLQVNATMLRLQRPPGPPGDPAAWQSGGWDSTRLFVQSASTRMQEASAAQIRPLQAMAGAVEVYPRASMVGILKEPGDFKVAPALEGCKIGLNHLVTAWSPVPRVIDEAAPLAAAQLPSGFTEVLKHGSQLGVCHLDHRDRGDGTQPPQLPLQPKRRQGVHLQRKELMAASKGGVHVSADMLRHGQPTPQSVESSLTREVLAKSSNDLTGIAVLRINLSLVSSSRGAAAVETSAGASGARGSVGEVAAGRGLQPQPSSPRLVRPRTPRKWVALLPTPTHKIAGGTGGKSKWIRLAAILSGDDSKHRKKSSVVSSGLGAVAACMAGASTDLALVLTIEVWVSGVRHMEAERKKLGRQLLRLAAASAADGLREWAHKTVVSAGVGSLHDTLTCLHLPARNSLCARIELPRYGRLSSRACRFAALSLAKWADGAGLVDRSSRAISRGRTEEAETEVDSDAAPMTLRVLVSGASTESRGAKIFDWHRTSACVPELRPFTDVQEAVGPGLESRSGVRSMASRLHRHCQDWEGYTRQAHLMPQEHDFLTTTETQEGTIATLRLSLGGLDAKPTWLVAVFRQANVEACVIGASARQAERLVGEVWTTVAFLSASEQLLRPRIATLKARESLPMQLPDLSVLRRHGNGDLPLPSLESCLGEHATPPPMEAFRALLDRRARGGGAGDSVQSWLPPTRLLRVPDEDDGSAVAGPQLPVLALACSGAAVGFRAGSELPLSAGSLDGVPRPQNTSEVAPFTLADSCLLTAFVAPRIPLAAVSALKSDPRAEVAQRRPVATSAAIDTRNLGLPFLNAKLFASGGLVAAATRDAVRWLADCARKVVHKLEVQADRKTTTASSHRMASRGSSSSSGGGIAASELSHPRSRSLADRGLSFSSHGTDSTRDQAVSDAALKHLNDATGRGAVPTPRPQITGQEGPPALGAPREPDRRESSASAADTPNRRPSQAALSAQRRSSRADTDAGSKQSGRPSQGQRPQQPSRRTGHGSSHGGRFVLKSSKSLRMGRRPRDLARRNLAQLAMQGASGGPGPQEHLPPPLPAPRVGSAAPGRHPHPELITPALLAPTSAGVTAPTAGGDAPGSVSQTGAGTPGSPESIPSSAADRDEAVAAVGGVPQQHGGRAAGATRANLLVLPTLAEAGAARRAEAVEACAMSAAVGVALAARCNPVVLAAVCAAVDAQAARRMLRSSQGPDPLQLARSALDLVTSQDGGCACLGSVGKEAVRYVLDVTGALDVSNTSPQGTSTSIAASPEGRSWLLDGLPGPSMHVKRRSENAPKARAAAQKEMGSLGRLVGFSADGRDVLANPPSVRAILQSAVRRMRSDKDGRTAPPQEPPGEAKGGGSVSARIAQFSQRSRPGLQSQSIPGGFGHFRAAEEILARTRLLDFKHQSEAEDRVMRSIGIEGTLGGAVAHGTEALRAVASVGTGDRSPFAAGPSAHGTAPNAYLRALLPGFGPLATVREDHREEALAVALLRQRELQLRQARLRGADPMSQAPPRSASGRDLGISAAGSSGRRSSRSGRAAADGNSSAAQRARSGISEMYGRQHLHRCGFEVPLVAGLSVASACAAVLSTLVASVRAAAGEWPIRACHFHTEKGDQGAAGDGSDALSSDVAWFAIVHAAAATVSRTRGMLGQQRQHARAPLVQKTSDAAQERPDAGAVPPVSGTPPTRIPSGTGSKGTKAVKSGSKSAGRLPLCICVTFCRVAGTRARQGSRSLPSSTSAATRRLGTSAAGSIAASASGLSGQYGDESAWVELCTMPVGVWRPSLWATSTRRSAPGGAASGGSGRSGASGASAPGGTADGDDASFAAAVRPIHDEVANTLSPARLRFAGQSAQAVATPLAGFELAPGQFDEISIPFTATSGLAARASALRAPAGGGPERRDRNTVGRAGSDVHTIGRLSPLVPAALRMAESAVSGATFRQDHLQPGQGRRTVVTWPAVSVQSVVTTMLRMVAEEAARSATVRPQAPLCVSPMGDGDADTLRFRSVRPFVPAGPHRRLLEHEDADGAGLLPDIMCRGTDRGWATLSQAAMHPLSRGIVESRAGGTVHASLSGMITLSEADTHPATFRQDNAGRQVDLFRIGSCGGQAFALAASKAVAARLEQQLQADYQAGTIGQLGEKDAATAPPAVSKGAPGRTSLIGSAIAPFLPASPGHQQESSLLTPASPVGFHVGSKGAGVLGRGPSSHIAGCFLHTQVRVEPASTESKPSTTGGQAASAKGVPPPSGPTVSLGVVSVDLWLLPVPIPAPASSPGGSAIGSIAVEYVAHVTSSSRSLAETALRSLQQSVEAASLAIVRTALLLCAWEAGILVQPSPEFWPRLVGAQAPDSEMDGFIFKQISTLLATPPPAGGSARGHGTIVAKTQAQTAIDLALGSLWGEEGGATDGVGAPVEQGGAEGGQSPGVKRGSTPVSRGGSPLATESQSHGQDRQQAFRPLDLARRSLDAVRRTVTPQQGEYAAGRSILLLACMAEKQLGKRELETPLRNHCELLRQRSRLHASAPPAVQQLSVLLRIAAQTQRIAVRAGLVTNAALRAANRSWVGQATAEQFPLRPSVVVLLVHAQQWDRGLLGICCADVPWVQGPSVEDRQTSRGPVGDLEAGAAGTPPVRREAHRPPDLRLFTLSAPSWSMVRDRGQGAAEGFASGWWASALGMLMPREPHVAPVMPAAAGVRQDGVEARNGAGMGKGTGGKGAAQGSLDDPPLSPRQKARDAFEKGLSQPVPGWGGEGAAKELLLERVSQAHRTLLSAIERKEKLHD